MIDHELLANDKNEIKAHILWHRFEELGFKSEFSDRELEDTNNIRGDAKVILSEEESQLSKPKGSRLSYYEKYTCSE